MAAIGSSVKKANPVNRILPKPNILTPLTVTHVSRGFRTSSSVYEKTTELNGGEVQKNPPTWSRDQIPKWKAMRGPRFEQTAFELQPNPLPAIELISQQPVQMVHGRVAVCDGGGGALGHPKVFINLDKPGAHACGYCGLRFQREDDH